MPRTSKSRIGDHSDAKWFIIIGVLLTLFAGSVVLLVKSPQIRTIFVRLPVPAPEEAAQPEEAAAPALEGLPEGGSVELVDVANAEGDITDQKVVWRTGSSDTGLIESVNTLLPALENGRRVLALFARPTGIGGLGRVFFSVQFDPFADPEGDMPFPLQLISFDPVLRAFIPLLNAPDVLSERTALSPNQHRIAYADAEDEGENLREIWIYDLVKDKRSRVVTLATSESLTSPFELRPGVQFAWKDPSLLQYKVYRAGEAGVSLERQLIATRTVKIEP